MKTFQSHHPYTFTPEFSKAVAYFSMEYAIHQPLKLYASGAGYIAGSYLRSAFALKQNVIGIGILWKYGYYDQVRKNDGHMDVSFKEKLYQFLQPTDIKFNLLINQRDVKVTAYYLPPEVFNTAPLYLLSTDLPENDYWTRSITHKLYDRNLELRTAAKILLGVGGASLLEALQEEPEIYHINNTEALPLAFFLLNKFKSREELKKRLVYTFYNIKGTDEHQSEVFFLEKMNYFNGIPQNVIKKIFQYNDDVFDHHLTALALSGVSCGLSKMHERTMKEIWKDASDLMTITHVTTGQNYQYWADHKMYKALKNGQDEVLLKRKKSGKRKLFEEVAEQTGKIFDENVLTLVWAKRFTSYRRPDLLLQDDGRLHELLTNKDFPVQIIFAGKPQPMDYVSISAFDKLVEWSKKYNNFAVLVGHELSLGKLLKGGADLWLHTQLHRYDASETSGISAAMNGSINFSTPDGWFEEFCQHGKNSFILNSEVKGLSPHEQEIYDIKIFFDMLEQEIIPIYYKQNSEWLEIIKESMKDIIPYFDSDRMMKEFYHRIYNTPESTSMGAESYSNAEQIRG